MNQIANLEHISKRFGKNIIFEDFSLSVQDGEFLVIVGKSGTGKSTLLNILGTLDQPDSGTVILFGEKNVKPFSRKSQQLLNSKITYIFQNFALLDDLSVEDNLKITLSGPSKAEKISRSLERVGLTGYENQKICECSGGEQQRVALARAFLKKGDLILADEPTGSLDPENADRVIGLLKELQKEGKTIVVVSHDQRMVNAGDRILHLRKPAEMKDRVAD